MSAAAFDNNKKKLNYAHEFKLYSCVKIRDKRIYTITSECWEASKSVLSLKVLNRFLQYSIVVSNEISETNFFGRYREKPGKLYLE